MPCPVVSFELQELRGDCVDERRQVVFRVTVHQIDGGTFVIGDIHTGDFSSGSEATISVYYPDSDDPSAWQDGTEENSKVRIYEHLYPPGLHQDVRLEFAPLPMFSDCEPVYLTGEDVEESKDSRAVIDVPPCLEDPGPSCPEITWDPVDKRETCNKDGLWDLSFRARVASTSVGGELFWVDEDETPHALENQNDYVEGGERVLEGSRAFPPGSYKVRAVTDCGSASVTGELPACPVTCPKIVMSQPFFGTSCEDGKREVFVTASVAMPPGHEAFLHARLLDEADTILDEVALSGSAISLSGSGFYAEGTRLFRVVLLSPQGCAYADGSNSIAVSVPGCPPPPDPEPNDPDCPDIVIEQLTADVEAGCTGTCPVTMVARVALPDDLDEPAAIELADESGSFDNTVATSGTIERTFERVYNAGEHLFRATVTLPSGCNYFAETPFTVAQPDPNTPPPWWPDWLPTPPVWLCLVWFWINIGLLILTAIMIFVAACFFTWWLAVIAVILAVVTLISIVLNIIFCAWYGDVCTVLRWLPRIIATIGLIAGVITLIVAIIQAIFFSEAGTVPSWPCFLGAVIEFAYYGFLAFVVWEVLFFFGCNPVAFQDIAEMIPQQDD